MAAVGPARAAGRALQQLRAAPRGGLAALRPRRPAPSCPGGVASPGACVRALAAAGRAAAARSSSLPERAVAARSAVDSSMAESNLVELDIKIKGMKCGGCSSRVEDALKAMAHVKAVQVDLESKLATVEVEAESLLDAMNMLPSFVETVKELGFEAEPHIDYEA
ncbi:hypothetical protein HT031_001607 [Scenedesmus sp. PABB004]|nr:hypothetical protein HT031_001607 [Scenedesmus sp. PABB004]